MLQSLAHNIIQVNIEDEMKKSYLDFAMSVIVARALPDVRDGLKPSQRRILVAMNDLGLAPNRQFRKCAKIAGDTSGNYHPHGEAVVYPTLVRMAQNFSMRYMLVEGQGNFGSIDGDPPAAMRYTESRMTPFAMEILADLEKDTVDYRSNYDETREEPTVLPGKFPNLICNGCSGIAVGMATNIPPHNLIEVVDGIVALINDPEMTVEELLRFIKGPDFPTGAIIYGVGGIAEAYRTGRGKITVRGRAEIEEQKSGKISIIIREIPYGVNKAALIEKIADLIRDKKIEGVADLRDETDREGIRMVVELKKEAYPEVVLNQLYAHTQLQDTFGIIMLALVDGRPQVLSLKQLLQCYIDHRHDIVVRRTRFELDEAQTRAHILEGLRIALDHIDEVINAIREASDPTNARIALMERFGLSETQAQAILSMQLQRLTGLERDKIEKEYLELIKLIARLEGILTSRTRRMDIIKSELLDIKKRYGDDRRTQIIEALGEFRIEDLIADEDMVITISHSGYIKRQPVSDYRRQHRGGRGVAGMATRDEDFVEHLFVASAHNNILFLTPNGKCYGMKVHEVPEGSRTARGRSIANLLNFAKDQKVAAVVPVREFDDNHYLVMATANGIIKKTPLSAYANVSRNGIIAITIDGGDSLIEAKLTDGSQEIILATRLGQAVRFLEEEVRPMGRTAGGVIGARLEKGDKVVGMVVVHQGGTLLTVCENGFGKRSPILDYRMTHRGATGVVNIKVSERNGHVVDVKEVIDNDELMIISQNGLLIRLRVGEIRTMGRYAQGIKLINLTQDDKVVDVARIIVEEEEGNDRSKTKDDKVLEDITQSSFLEELEEEVN